MRLRKHPKTRKQLAQHFAVGAVLFASFATPMASASAFNAASLGDLSLEELLKIEFSTVSERALEALTDASAVYVITAEDIQRSGRRHVAEILRMAPGVHVSRVDSNKWTVGIRGMGSRFTNRYVVLLDGRSMYSRSLPAVMWDAVDTIIDDIDRIEVIRGPGASLWGSNAVNGVINIVSKSSQQTTGTQITVSSGSHTKGAISGRQGFDLGSDRFLRVYGSHSEYDNFDTVQGSPQGDAWRRSVAGLRYDRSRSEHSHITVTSEIAESHPDENFRSIDYNTLQLREVPSRNKIRSGFLNFLWTRQLSANSETTLQTYYDHETRESALIGLERDTVDIDFKHRWKQTDSLRLIWGAGYRESKDILTDSDIARAQRRELTVRVSQAFLQEEYQATDTFKILAGLKLENNTFSDFEVQPSLKMDWEVTGNFDLWSSVSKAVRTPSRFSNGLNVDIPNLLLPPNSPLNSTAVTTVVSLRGVEGIEPEELIAYELGARWQASDALEIDVALFWNDYDKLTGTQVSFPDVCYPLADCSLNNFTRADLQSNNAVTGRTIGGEINVHWQATDSLSFDANYSIVDYKIEAPYEEGGFLAELSEVQNPRHIANLRTHYQLSDAMAISAWLRHTDKLAGLEELPTFSIPSYTEFDLNLSYAFSKSFEARITAANLLDNQHLENASELGDVEATLVPRMLRLDLVWRLK